MIIKEERIGGQRLILGDCREIIVGLTFDAIVTDPPYGIGYASSPVVGKNRASERFAKSGWDDAAPVMLDIVARAPSVVWGGNYFGLPPSRGWLVWHKPDIAPSLSQVELAWTSLDRTAQYFRSPIAVYGKERVASGGGHPTQKPVALMEWCLGFLPNAQTILDPFMGSGTTLVACQRMGRNGTGIELDPDYFEIACKRVDEAARQPDLLIPAPRQPPVQEGLDL
jgi:site-specific DNA-methyltransferase (adenine-specific)